MTASVRGMTDGQMGLTDRQALARAVSCAFVAAMALVPSRAGRVVDRFAGVFAAEEVPQPREEARPDPEAVRKLALEALPDEPPTVDASGCTVGMPSFAT
jgi:hypothetical protein